MFADKIFSALTGITIGIIILSLPFKVSVLLVVGSLLFAVILFRTEVGFLLTVAAIPFESVGAITATGPSAGFTTISVIKIFGLLTFLSWLIHFIRRRLQIIIKPQLIIIAALICSAIASIYFGTYFGEYFERLAKNYFMSYMIYLGIFFMTINIVRSEDVLKRVVVVLVITGLVASLFTFVQRWTPAFQREVITVEDDYYRSTGVILDPSEESTLGKVKRTSSWMLHPDFLALFLTLTIALNLYKLEYSRSNASKAGWTIMLAVQAVALMLTYSRGATLTLIIVVLLMILRSVIKPSWEKILITAGIALVIVLVVTPSTTALDRIFSIEHYRESDSISARVELIRAGMEMFKDHNWLLGVGMGNYDYHLPHYSKKIPYLYEPNNDFLRIFTEMGILGILLTMVLYVFTFNDFRTARKNFQNNDEVPMSKLAATLEICLIGFIFFSLTQTTIGRKEWPLVMALAIVLKRLSMSEKKIKLIH